MSAVDRDEGDNARVHYLLPAAPSRSAVPFLVDQRGVLTVLHSIDREKHDTFRFSILAVDLGTPPRTGSALIVIDVEDVNDEPPVFLAAHYRFSLAENEGAGARVGVVMAVDADTAPHNGVVYSLVGGGRGVGAEGRGEVFAIDRLSGVITARRGLDREELDEYQVVG